MAIKYLYRFIYENEKKLCAFKFVECTPRANLVSIEWKYWKKKIAFEIISSVFVNTTWWKNQIGAELYVCYKIWLSHALV